MIGPAFLLDNGAMYHIANGIAVVEYLITLHFKPSFKLHPYISAIGEALPSVSALPHRSPRHLFQE